MLKHLFTSSRNNDISLFFNHQVCSSPVDFAGEIISSGVLSAPGRVNGTEIVDVAPGNLNFSNGISNVDLIPMDLSDSSDSEEEAVVEIVPTCPAPHDDGKVVVDTVIPCDVNTLFTMLFTNSKFYLEFHTMRKTFGNKRVCAFVSIILVQNFANYKFM